MPLGSLILDVPIPPFIGFPPLIFPVVAPCGTVAVICVSVSNEKLALTLLNFTPEVPRKLVPKMKTFDPIGPLMGEKLVIVGVLKIVVV